MIDRILADEFVLVMIGEVAKADHVVLPFKVAPRDDTTLSLKCVLELLFRVLIGLKKTGSELLSQEVEESLSHFVT